MSQTVSQVDPHPAAALPEGQRLEYLRLVASMATVDGHIAEAERTKLERLGRVLGLRSSLTAPLFAALRRGELDAPVPAEHAATWRNQGGVRWHLVIDSIVIAFADGALARTESERVGRLARLMSVSPAEVGKMAELVERILFQRAPDERVLARELGAAIGEPEGGEQVVALLHEVAGKP